ncbi:MAG: HU family DNA-binding protein [Patescibacteria group bacterium]
MTKIQLIETLATRSGLSKKDVDRLLDAFVSLVTEKIKAGEKVAVTGFGTFSVTERKARTGVNPQNPSQKIQIPAMKVPKFTAGKTLKDSLK